MGAAPGGEPGEAWGYRQLPLAVGAVEVGLGQLAFGPPAEPGQPDPQLAFLRYTDATGWQVFETPVDEQRQPLPRAGAEPRSRRGSPRERRRRPGRPRPEPAGRRTGWSSSTTTRAAAGARCEPPPPTSCCRPKAERRPRRSPTNSGAGAVADRRLRRRRRTPACCFAPDRAARSPTAIAPLRRRRAGAASRSRCRPARRRSFHILAIDATGLGNAWALAEADAVAGPLASSCCERDRERRRRRSGSSGRSARTPFADRDDARRRDRRRWRRSAARRSR